MASGSEVSVKKKKERKSQEADCKDRVMPIEISNLDSHDNIGLKQCYRPWAKLKAQAKVIFYFSFDVICLIFSVHRIIRWIT